MGIKKKTIRKEYINTTKQINKNIEKKIIEKARAGILL